MKRQMMSHSDIYKSACWFIDRGYSVIPVRKSNKRSLVKWTEFQSRTPTHEEIKRWWDEWPDANIALVTGKLSGITVVDIDTEEGHANLNEFLPETFLAPTTRTPSGGWHYFFKYRPGLKNTARVIEGTDIRTDGGYAIIPPSKNGNGKQYVWVKGLKINEIQMPDMPEFLFDILSQGSNTPVLGTGTESNSSNFLKKDACARACGVLSTESAFDADNNQQHLTTSNNIFLRDGVRDEGIFHVANCLIKGGMNEPNTRKCLEILSMHCDPPFEKNIIPLKIKSAMDRAKKRDIGLTEEIREWVLTTSGNFSTTFVYNSLNLTTSDNKKKAAVVLGRLCEEGIIERVGQRRGEYRLIERDLEFQDLTKAKVEESSLWLPLGLDKMVRLFPGNIIVIAGAPNSGKTAFLLSCCRYNMKNMKTRYLSSEMCIEEAADRIKEFDDITLSGWQKHWEFSERYDNFQDAILTGKGNLNIIDYLEQPEGEAFRASSQLSDIHKKLDGAIAIIALQKNRGKGRETGVGGDQTLAKPRLYIAMDYGWGKIIKCKSFKKDFGNPNWMECTFKLGAGHHFVIDREWQREIKE